MEHYVHSDNAGWKIEIRILWSFKVFNEIQYHVSSLCISSFNLLSLELHNPDKKLFPNNLLAKNVSGFSAH